MIERSQPVGLPLVSPERTILTTKLIAALPATSILEDR